MSKKWKIFLIQLKLIYISYFFHYQNNSSLLKVKVYKHVSVCLVAQLCPTLCDPIDCSTPGLPIHNNSWNLLKLVFIESVMPSNHLILCHLLLLLPSIFPSISSFQMSQLFTSGSQSIGVSASASVFPMNIQD